MFQEIQGMEKKTDCYEQENLQSVAITFSNTQPMGTSNSSLWIQKQEGKNRSRLRAMRSPQAT